MLVYYTGPEKGKVQDKNSDCIDTDRHIYIQTQNYTVILVTVGLHL